MLKYFKPSRNTPLRPVQKLEIEGVEFPVEVKNNSRSKQLTLRLNPDGRGAKVTTPPHVSDREITNFVEKNRNWIAVRLARLPKATMLHDGVWVLYEGIEHKITHLDRSRGIVEAKLVAGEPTLLVPGEVEHMPRRVIDFMKKQARKKLDLAVTRYAGELGVRPKSMRITDAKSRWGSCSTTRTLSFSWRIIMAPPAVLDYLAAHEVAHLREMNHSEKFWELVEEMCPGMQEQKNWLRRHGPALHSVRLD
ncbi:MAG: M48 family metallopeptidase [Hyphomicrobiales bacterium]|nr:M48 family metallopeptidase [Hyphomicrobiales bacterium]